MPHAVKCPDCGAKFALPDDLFDRKVKGRVVTVRCKRCQGNITVDGVELASQPPSERPEVLDESAIDSRPLDETPTIPLTGAKASAIPPVKGLWLVSYADDDDRELTRSQIEAALSRGEIDADTIVWREGMAEWKVIADVPALADLLEGGDTKGGDTTGGFLGTGMTLSPGEKALKAAMEKAKKKRPTLAPPPSQRAPQVKSKGAQDTEAGPFKSVSAGTLYLADKDAVPESLDPVSLQDDEIESVKDRPRPKSEPPKKPQSKPPPARPKPTPLGAKKPAQLRPDDGVEEDAPSSGTPDLRSLTTAAVPLGRAKKQAPPSDDRADEDIFNLGTGSIVGSALAPPTIDLSTPTAPEAEEDEDYEVEDDDRDSDPPKKAAGERKPAEKKPAEKKPVATKPTDKKRKSADSVAATAKSAPARRAPDDDKKSSPVVWLLLAGAAVIAGVWFFTKSGAEPQEPLAPRDPVARESPPETPTAEPVPTPTEADDTPPAPTETATVSEAPPTSDPARPTEKPREPSEPTAKPSDTTEAPSETPAAEPTEKPTAKPAEPEKEVPIAAAFDKGAAIAALNSAAGAASACRQEGDPSGMATVVVTFAPSGRVTSANVNGPPFAGTRTGGCIASTMRRARVPAFSGDHVTVSKTVTIH